MVTNTEKERELGKLMDLLGRELDPTETQFKALIASYNAVGQYLCKDTTLSAYQAVYSPQGSLRLGTIIQPVNPDDDLDVDMVLLLGKKPYSWTQKDLKNSVGCRIKDSDRYSKMLSTKEGRRCWTLLYRDNSDNPKERYHMDILPAIADGKYGERVSSMYLSDFSIDRIKDIIIRITDKKRDDYTSSISIENWNQSNPDGYAMWFFGRCMINHTLTAQQRANLITFDKFTQERLPLQRMVQILKRHRDIMFEGDEDKPISVIITTLAGKAYNGESDLFSGLKAIVSRMPSYIVEKDGQYIISNPVDEEENFADKWVESPKKKDNFFKWLEQVKADLDKLSGLEGIHTIKAELSRAFGEQLSSRVVNRYSDIQADMRSKRALSISAAGTLSSVGKAANTANNFYGKE